MPADVAKSKVRRDAAEERIYSLGQGREIEMKRSRGEVSCAECRRLKIKCDKQIPCQSCVRRGCEILCPNDSFTTGQGTRSVIEATGHLYTQIKRLTERNRELEGALAKLQQNLSTEPHPLLHKPDEPDPADRLIDWFGTLSISDNGASRFIGPTGGSELQTADDRALPSRPPSPPALPADVQRFSAAFPFTPLGPPPAVLSLIHSYLPPWDRALAVCDTYLAGAAWLFHAVPRAQLIDELLPAIYRRPSPRPSPSAGAHDYALLFVVFAVGTLVDMEHGPRDAEAEHFFRIASAAVCLESLMEKPSLVTVQAIHLMSIYNAMSPHGTDTSMETTWQLVTIGARLALSVNKDSARWGLPYRLVQRRRFIFWDLFLADGWQASLLAPLSTHTPLTGAHVSKSLASGRPPVFSLPYVDCKFPDENDPTKERESAGEREFESWGYRFSAECIAPIAETVLAAHPPTYAAIAALDRKVRAFPMPQHAAPAPDGGGVAESMQRFCMSNVRETALLYIHRSFFALALTEHPADPLQSRYAASFVAAYTASAVILDTIARQYAVCPDLVARFWTVWAYAFSAAVVFGTVVTRSPRSALAASAIEELEKARAMFTRAARLSRRAAKALPVIARLCDKARAALAQSQSQSQSPSTPRDDADDELAIFAGRTRLVSDTGRTSKKPAQPGYFEAQAPAREQDLPPIALPVLPAFASSAPSDGSWTSGYSRAPPDADSPQYAASASWHAQEYRARQHQYHQAPHPPPYPAPPAELAELGLVSRQSRLDERWASFMQDSGVLDQDSFRST
ncbi:hypothetical protein NEOLEDRAFT_1114509 [Neolentinus lepideus HHB14362 ss-1]|uniref:Zn(2)-C6 fungal-type domain-containing protein n=1 Tax=Neolentinus lepideus HHB14362 ss-1 TaxID=1314782 RepID=A0A165SKI9_9AGAM|nr:hypothetical protein NEOLEDRAFT_1114509 [Neolentinus lepideus HHB14362 ss-1]